MPVSQEEKDLLQRGKDFADLADSPGWNRILSVIQEWEQHAHDDVLSSVDLPDAEISKRVQRWQERQSLHQTIVTTIAASREELVEWVQSLEHDPHKQFVLEELNGNDPNSDTGPYSNS